MKGIGASQGIAIGKIHIKAARVKLEKSIAANADAEAAKLNGAIEASRQQLARIMQDTASAIGEEEAGIFEAHLMILEDPEFIDKAMDKVRNEKLEAAWAVHEAAEELKQLFAEIEDEYIRERILDLRDVSLRLIDNIRGCQGFDPKGLTEPVILTAEELTPSDMSSISTDKVLGIITETGGATSHTAIISRVMGLPAVVGVQGLMELLKDGDTVIMNGETGELFIHPDQTMLDQYKLELANQLECHRELQRYMGVKTISADGCEISIGCNIGTPKDVEAVLKNDGEGIGLFRSEFLFMDRNTMPSEEEQFQAYKKVLELMNSKPVIIRTMDIGGDKQIPYMNFPKEENPFLGYRAIRYCLEEREQFRIQLRAILRASAYGNAKIMLPMVAAVEEVTEARGELHKAMSELDERGENYDRCIELGIMIEIPAAALISDQLAEVADFFSIGTNDLTQYTLAVDRMNSKIAHLYKTSHPAVLRLIKLTIENAKRTGKWVGMCGEAAQNEELVPLFLGMGIDELSVSPPQVLRIRKLISGLSKNEMAKRAAEI